MGLVDSQLNAVALIRLNTEEPPVINRPGRYINLLQLLQLPLIDRLLFQKAYDLLLGE